MPVYILVFPGGSVVKNSSANIGDTGSIPGSGRFLGEGNGNLLHAWEIPRTEEPVGPRSIVLQRVGHNLATKQPQQVHILLGSKTGDRQDVYQKISSKQEM